MTWADDTGRTAMRIELHEGDLPEAVRFSGSVAVDSETMGLEPMRDRLCLVQLCGADGAVHLVRFAPAPGAVRAPRLVALLEDPAVLKILHFARFDMAVLRHRLGARLGPVWCTKIASKLARTYTDRHGLKDLCRELLGVELNKAEQSSDWGAAELSEAQRRYAAGDVVHLHALKAALEAMLIREGRLPLAERCMGFLPTRVELDLAGWPLVDVFAH
jgi:ribonuclease D